MELSKTPNREQFELLNMKSVDRLSVDFNATKILIDGEETCKIPINGPYPIVPHPDLLHHMDRLKLRLAEFFGYSSFESFVAKKDFGATTAQKKLVKEFKELLLEKMRVTGLAYSGKDKIGVVVKGVYNGSAINTKPLYFTNEIYGDELQEICDAIDSEIFEYVFLGKKAQLEAFE